MVRRGLEDQEGHGKTHWKKTWTYWASTGVTREILSTIVLLRTGGT